MRISDWSSDVCSSDLNFLKGDAKGDQGQLAKQLKRFIKNCIYLCEQKDIGFLMTNHTYASQDMFNPDAKIKIGRASCRERVCQYVSISVVAVSLKKKKREKK